VGKTRGSKNEKGKNKNCRKSGSTQLGKGSRKEPHAKSEEHDEKKETGGSREGKETWEEKAGLTAEW